MILGLTQKRFYVEPRRNEEGFKYLGSIALTSGNFDLYILESHPPVSPDLRPRTIGYAYYGNEHYDYTMHPLIRYDGTFFQACINAQPSDEIYILFKILCRLV